MVDGEPDLALRVEHAAQVGPGDRKVGPGLNRFQVAGLGGQHQIRDKERTCGNCQY